MSRHSFFSRSYRNVLPLIALIASMGWRPLSAAEPQEADVIVYGGTSGAVVAAQQARKMGKSVLLISPDKHLGGMTSGGLGCTDMGDEKILGGLAVDFYHRIWSYYKVPSAWPLEPRYGEKQRVQETVAIDDKRELMFTFEPKAAESVFNDIVTEYKIPVIHARIDLKGESVTKDKTRITAIRMEDGREFRGKLFIDATYEGDLMAKAKVSYTFGREANSAHNETVNGLQVKRSVKNQLPAGIDPYVTKGDATSGLLPGVRPTPQEADGTADTKIQAYCYRMCLTNDARNRVNILKPENYDERNYELLFRAIEAGIKPSFFKLSAVPNHKTDSNNGGGLSTDYIGMNHDYPEGDYATREKIANAHRDWQLGLLWTLQHHDRVPEKIRKTYASWGLPKDEFTDNGNWSPALYVREARRMTSDYFLTEPLLLKRKTARSIGMGAYKMDSHHVQRIVGPNGDVRNEGDVQQTIAGPYQIDYGTLTPKKTECTNLLVPFCISASHMAFGSVRMEPVFMILSQSAATAGVMALDANLPVQDVPYAELRKRLLADKQVLEL